MNVQTVSFQALNPILDKKKPKTTRPSGQLQKPDTFEKSSKDTTGIGTELLTIKDKKGKQVFNTQHIVQIVKNIEKEPERYDAIKTMAYLPNMKGKDLARISYAKADSLNIVKDFSQKKDVDGNYKYASSHLVQFSTLPAPELKRITPLTDTTLKAQEIVDIARNKELNLEKLGKKIIDMEKVCGEKSISSVSFKKDIYDPENSYVLTGTTKTGVENSELLDKNLNRLAIDKTLTYFSKNDTQYIVRKTNDYRNNTTSQVRSYVDDAGYPNVQDQVRIIKDKNGKVQHKEYMTMSAVKGVYDMKNVYPDGRIEQISEGKVNPKNGVVTIKKDMLSPDGTRTQYKYLNDPQGNKVTEYIITDKNGKKLLNNKQFFDVISENKFISAKNGKTYEMTVSDDQKSLTVKDKSTNEENVLNLGKMLKGDRKSMLNLLKKFPGEELMSMKDTLKNLTGAKSIEDCFFDPDSKEISTTDNLYSVLHELGHSKDFYNGSDVLTGKKDVQEVFDGEKAAFNKAFPDAQREHINYFLDVEEHYSGPRGGLEETVAESNALLNSYNDEMDIAARSQYLQQYFPRTIAKLSEYLCK